ncbi:Gfo/Idh/MocA family oxidoreductase [Halomontanus rarus]|uniref:Gfo/Idh/MocA family oxidoreductase n=1 Tax=Halomontanus rarus TaxID=3034020 RepID=UPI001A994911
MSDLTKPIRWGVIGCGDVVARKSGPAIHHAARSRMQAVVSSDGTSAEAYAAANAVPIATDDAEQVLTDSEIDAVYVATPPNTHREYTVAAAEAGKPVLVEKPMGRSVTEAQAMIDACDRNDVELFVAYYRRFHPHVLKMRELLNADVIGDPLRAFVDHGSSPSADSGWRETPAISGGGRFVDATSHRVDLLCYLLGAPTDAVGAVRSDGEEPPVEDIVSMTISIDDVLCTVVSDFASEEVSDTFHVFGTEGHIKATVLDDGTFVYETEGESGRLDFDVPAAPHGGLIGHVEAVLLDGATNRSTGRDGLQTEAVLDTCVRRTYADAIPVDVWDGSLADLE